MLYVYCFVIFRYCELYDYVIGRSFKIEIECEGCEVIYEIG